MTYSRIQLTLLLLFTLTISCGSNKENEPIKAQGLSATQERKTIDRILAENNHLPIEERIALYHKLKKNNPENHTIDEAGLNIYGYSLLWDNKIDEALEIFKLVVEEYPDSSNAYDSLGEAYLKKGDKVLALKNYEISLSMNPDNFFAEDQIEGIKFPGKKELEPYQRFSKIYSVDEYKADLDQFAKKIISSHPTPFKFITEKDFMKNVEEVTKKLTTETTFAEFTWSCSKILASIDCSHSSTDGFYTESSMLKLPLIFPIQTLWLDNKLYVVDALSNSDKIKIKDQIVSINGRSVNEIVKDAYQHISAQGNIETTKRLEFNEWSTEMIPYVMGFPKEYTVQVKDKAEPINLKEATAFVAPYNDPTIKRYKSGLHLDTKQDKNSAVLTISSFNFYPFDNRIAVFEKFIDSTFGLLKSKGTKNLIVDLRFNGGGSSESSMYLLRYLMEDSFRYIQTSYTKGQPEDDNARKDLQVPFTNRFKGKIYFLIDGHGNSTTGHFMSFVKKYKLGSIIGEELGSNQFCTAGQTPCRLKNTKLIYSLATNVNLTTADDFPLEKGIMPDYPVQQTIDEYLAKKDAVMALAFQLIGKTEQIETVELPSTKITIPKAFRF